MKLSPTLSSHRITVPRELVVTLSGKSRTLFDRRLEDARQRLVSRPVRPHLAGAVAVAGEQLRAGLGRAAALGRGEVRDAAVEDLALEPREARGA